MRLVGALTLALIGVSSAVSAQQVGGAVLELGYAEVADKPGFEFGAGYRLGYSNVAVSGIIGGFVHESEDDRYYYDSSVDRCRDSTNGQFAKDEECGSDVSAYAKLELIASFGPLDVGAGYRFAEENEQPYATVEYEFSENFAAKLSGGEDYIGVAVAFRR